MKDTLKYFANTLGLVHRINGAKYPASPPSVLSRASGKNRMAFLGQQLSRNSQDTFRPAVLSLHSADGVREDLWPMDKDP